MRHAPAASPFRPGWVGSSSILVRCGPVAGRHDATQVVITDIDIGNSEGTRRLHVEQLVGDVGGLVVMVVVGRIAALTIRESSLPWLCGPTETHVRGPPFLVQGSVEVLSRWGPSIQPCDSMAARTC